MYHFAPLGEYNIMVIELLGQNLEELMMSIPSKKLSLKSVLMIADQLVFSYI